MAGESDTLPFQFYVPSQLKVEEAEFHRDIIRIIAMRDRPLSFGNLELPAVWNDGQANFEGQGQGGRQAATIRSPGFTWWIEDHKFQITKRRY